MAAETVFSRIIRGELPADVVYRDELCVAFRDIHPQAPVHILVVPQLALPGLQDAATEHQDLLGHLLLVARQVAEQEGCSESGFRVIINCGADGGQEVPHLHIHVLGGRRLGAMVPR